MCIMFPWLCEWLSDDRRWAKFKWHRPTHGLWLLGSSAFRLLGFSAFRSAVFHENRSRPDLPGFFAALALLRHIAQGLRKPGAGFGPRCCCPAADRHSRLWPA